MATSRASPDNELQPSWRSGTQPCRYFVPGSSSSCKHGTSCKFRHSSDMPIKPHSASSYDAKLPSSKNPQRLLPSNLSVPCRNFSSGSCRFGASCSFLHHAGDGKSRNKQPFTELEVRKCGKSLLDMTISPIKPHSASSYDAKLPSSRKPERLLPSNLAHPRTTSVPCLNFNSGSCRFGASCNFLHHAGDGKTKNKQLFTELEVRKWLISRQKSTGHDNIAYLTSSEGFDTMLKILNQATLSKNSIEQIVLLLTGLELRTSLLKSETDKVYNALIGSQFLNMLHLHIRTNVKAETASIEPFVFLCEEIMSRTSEGWKEVPLDELRTLADEAGDAIGRDLSSAITRLLDHRAKTKRMEALDHRMENLSTSLNFRDLPIIPSMEHLLSTGKQNQLPINLVGLRYTTVAAYLETHFRLMQEDCIATLRNGVCELRENSRSANLHVYRNVRLHSIEGGLHSLVYRISLQVNGRRGWEQTSKRLMHGSLLCISCDKFQTFLWAVVANRNTELLANGLIDIQVLEHSDQIGVDASRVYLMAESSAAYFEAYSHVLRNLQRSEMDNLPFQEHLVFLEPHVKEPTYLKDRNQQDVYDFECAFPLMKNELTTTRFHILQNWPEWTSSLDKSQIAALKHGLTKRLALIQGPPGTGKTFIGLMMAKIMLKNLKQIIPHSIHLKTVQGPILIICYTNHALDQFMKGIYAYEKNIIRVGERSKCPELEKCNLQALLRDHERIKSIYRSLYNGQMEAYLRQKELKEQILECGNMMRICIVTEVSLHGVATEDQIQSLFYAGCNPVSVVKMWLNGTENYHASVHDLDNRSDVQTVSEYNPFSVLMDAEKGSDILEEDFLGGCRDQIVVPHKLGNDKEHGSTESLDGSDIFTEDSLHSEINTSDSMHRTRLTSNKNQPDLDIGGTNLVEVHEDDSLHSEGNPSDSTLTDSLTLKDNESNLDIDVTNFAQGHEEPEWIMTKTRKSRPYRLSKRMTTEMIPATDIDPEWSLEMLKNFTDMWSLGVQARNLLHEHWLHTIRQEAHENMCSLSKEYEELCKNKLDMEKEIQLSLMRKAKVVGMTTTRAARHHDILESLQAEIIIIEEAAEVLESHILACLNSSTKHLILIGDHLQLRPSVAVHELAVKNHLDVSLFERLVESGIEFVTLEIQRRMRPDISKLISSIYPMLKDHSSTLILENVKGLKSNVFFFNHDSPEEHCGDEESSRRNTEEAQLVVELCSYLLKQGYKDSEITILSMYNGQTREIVRRLALKLRGSSQQSESMEKIPRVSSVDDYQGEECKIIILSLVRSNQIPTKHSPGKIGFLKVSNRVCVALSRAKNGLFIFGNGELLSEKSGLWNTVIKELQSSQSYGNALILSCQNHPETETKIFKPNDFLNVRDGGCDKLCDHQLNCGHVCPKHCHPYNHDMIVCPKRCPRKMDACDHQCQSLCHGFTECPPCKVLVVKELPQCGHSVQIACSTPPESVVCNVPCPKLLDCTHKCQSTCGKTCTSKCRELVERFLICSHKAKIECHHDPSFYFCKQPCKEKLPECHHMCKGSCGACKQGKEHIPCQEVCNRVLPCGHPCKALCHKTCPPCSMPCQKRCMHSRCVQTCGYPCIPCMEPCSWKCMHYSCMLLCHELCERPCCNEPCAKVLNCGHPCMGLCGEPCPQICRFCKRPAGFIDIFSQMRIEELDGDEHFIELQDCKHVFEVTGLDSWMHMEQSESGTCDILPKQCPQCRMPISRSQRYGNVIKAKLNQIAEVKMRIMGFAATNEGIRCLQEGRFIEAIEKFLTAVEKKVASFQTYFGLGSAFCSMSMFNSGAYFMNFIVKHSALVNEADKVESSQVDGMNSIQCHLFLAGEASKDVSKVALHGIWNGLVGPEQLVQKLKRIIQNTLSNDNLVLQDRVSHELAVKAMNQWASALTNLKKFEAAKKACHIVLEKEPGNRKAIEILESANRGERSQIVEIMMKEVGGRGHWYQCPNGHYYVVGECGGPMQLSRCPDCRATVGGQNHNPAEGNMHSDIDGSSHSAWSNQTGLGDF